MNATNAERLVWHHLRAKKIGDVRFRRQEPIGPYIVDFVCFERKLIIEVDGGRHGAERDSKRDDWLNSQGFRVLSFWNNEVLANIDGVLRVITEQAERPPPPDLLPRGEEE